MCVSPVKIYNRFAKTQHLRSELGEVVEVSKHLYSHREYIDVPCGKCAECRSKYIQSLYQRAYVESLSSYVYFITLTYDNNHIPCITLPSGKKVFYSDYSHISQMFDRFRKNFDREYRYLCVNEYGDTNNRPHFHILLFVGKQDTDTFTTPLLYESFIRDNLGKYFSINVGTRKAPKYERLYTFAYKYVGGVLYTNYFVKYIDPKTTNSVVTSEHSSVMSKTIRYLINYVNKGSRLEQLIADEIDVIEDDKLKAKYKFCLSCRVRFSKNFGSGFDNGRKFELPIISERMSYLDHAYKSIIDKYESIYQLSREQPKIYKKLLKFAQCPPYDKYEDVVEFTKKCPKIQLFYHLLLLHLDKPLFDTLYRRYFNHTRPFISYFYLFVNPTKYVKKVVKSYEPESSVSFNYIRKCVNAGITHAMPFLSFVDESTQNYYSLCDYFKVRCTTLQDFDDMLYACGFKDYDDWIANFTRYINTKKADKAFGNLSLPTDFVQRNCVASKPIEDVHRYFFQKI